MNKDTKARSWFCVWNNPQEHLEEKEPIEIVNKIIDMWVKGHPTRTCAVNYEIGDSGTPHCHMVLEDTNQVRFSSLQNMFKGIHVQETKGSKAQAEDYIYKRGKFAEKNQTLIIAPVFHGEIKAHQGARNDLCIIQDMLEQGYTPNEIMDSNFMYRKFETMIRKQFFRNKILASPVMRDVEVIWHVGESGSGKSYTYNVLCQKYGRDNIYYLTDYGSGGFDTYCAEPYLFMEEFKGNMEYQKLLNLLDKYPAQIHCRYANAIALWKEVHITSVYPPEEIYKIMVDSDRRGTDTFEQLKRRISTIIYHYIENGQYCEFAFPMCAEYTSIEDIKAIYNW